ncbi:MAG: pilus assembly protein PilM, partial [Oscillospiraceae bacterium]|nr:pilus assembly protein PilM [Oscillospiraceae bacterium]
SENNGKIRITAAATLELEEGVINNGHVKDVPRLATLVNKLLRTHKMSDKEACVTISSNLVIFKELHIKKPEKGTFIKAVQDEMRSAMNLDSTYSISYVVVGPDENDKSLTVVLATACPFEIIECYSKVCNMLQIQLKSAIISCNCATKVLLSDKKNESRMPLLAVQVDNTFISINVYDHGQLVFTRFASIAPEDYGNSDDYVFEAVQENIDRMLQFYRVTSVDRPIEHIIFYGDTRDYVRYVKVMDEDYGIQTSTITAPPNIHGYENLEFAQYVNAIGALFSRDKTKDWVNLLEVDTVNTAKLKAPKFFAALYFSVMLVVVAGLGTASFFIIKEKNDTEDEIKSYDQKINDPANLAKMDEVDVRDAQLAKIANYSNGVSAALDAYDTHTLLESDIFKEINDILLKVSTECELVDDPSDDVLSDVSISEIKDNAFDPDEESLIIPAGAKCKITTPSYSEGAISFSVTAFEPIEETVLDGGVVSDADPAEFPKALVREFWASDTFTDPDYTTYAVTYGLGEEENIRQITFSLSFKVKSNIPENLKQYLPATEQTGGATE